jgi:hypothetical protein
LAPANVPAVGQLSVSPSNHVFVGTQVSIATSASGAQPLSLQWQFNSGGGFTNLIGANTSTLSLNAVLADTGVYQLVVSNVYGAVTSAPASLTVTRDTTPPAVVQAANIGTASVEVVFSKVVEAATATNVGNYVFTNGLAISGVSLAASQTTVTLATAPLVYGSNYTLVINRVRDLAIPPNTIASNTAVSFMASPLAPQDIGNPSFASTTVVSSNGILVTAAGSGTGGVKDQFNFQYEKVSGNFDVSICLAGLGLSDVWAEAGLMARASLSPGDAFVAALATPGMAGCFFQDRAWSGATAASSGTFPVNYPNTWLRLQRVGPTFTGFASYDGQTWSMLGTAAIGMTDPIYLGWPLPATTPIKPPLPNF